MLGKLKMCFFFNVGYLLTELHKISYKFLEKPAYLGLTSSGRMGN